MLSSAAPWSRSHLLRRLNLAGVGGAVEQPELNRSLSEESVEVDAVIPAGVVMLMVDAAGVTVIGGAVPDALQAALGFLAVILHGFQQRGVHLLAPVVCAGANFQSLVEQVLPANGEVHQAGQAGWGVVLAVHMDVDAAGAVGDCPGLAESADDVLQILQILVLEDGGHDLAGIVAANKDSAPAGLALGLDAAIGHGFPSAALAVGGAVGSVVSAEVAGPCAEVGGDDVGGLLTGDTRQLNLHTKVLLLHHVVHLCDLL